MRSLWRYALAVSALMAASLLLAACGGEEEEEAAATTTATPAATREPKLTSFQVRTAEAYARMAETTTFPYGKDNFRVEYHPDPPLLEVIIKADTWEEYYKIVPERTAFLEDRGIIPWKIEIYQRVEGVISSEMDWPPYPYDLKRRTLRAVEKLTEKVTLPYHTADFSVEYHQDSGLLDVEVKASSREKCQMIILKVQDFFRQNGVDLCKDRVGIGFFIPDLDPQPEEITVGLECPEQ